jgi:hypothetical protein
MLVDASIYATVPDKIDLNARRHLAMGEVSKNLANDLDNKLARMRRGESVDAAQLKDFSASRKILLVHSAVNDRAVFGSLLPRDELILPHSCLGLEALVRQLSGSVHMVIHGHLHHPNIYGSNGVNVISAATTSQKNGQNGFFVLKFYTSGDVCTEHHKWVRNGFVLDDNPDLNLRMSLNEN